MTEVWVPCYGRHRWATDTNGRTVCEHCGHTLNPQPTPNCQLELQVDS